MKSIFWLLLFAPVCGSTALAVEPDSWQRPNWELYAHESVLIDAPARAIWPYIQNTDQWKHALHHRLVSGVAGERGEVVAESLAADQAPLFYIETVELVPNVRRTIKLVAANHGPLMGFASWELEETTAGTRVTYNVYSEALLSAKDLQSQSSAALAAAERASATQNQERFRAELQDLKRLVEQSRRGRSDAQP
jgi:hypothetical protein